MKKLLLGLLSIVTMGQLALVALPVGAQGTFDPSTGNALGGLEATNLGNGQGAAQAGSQLPVLIGRIIRTVLGLLGIIFLVLTVYAGFVWMMARGDSKKADESKTIIKNAVIGIVIIFIAYALTGFIINAIVRATSTQ